MIKRSAVKTHRSGWWRRGNSLAIHRFPPPTAIHLPQVVWSPPSHGDVKRNWYNTTGNLRAAEGLAYKYEVQNRTTTAPEGGLKIRAFTNDGDGTVRTVVPSGSPVTRFVTPY